jgi:para-aminobenzoate synthetase component 2
MFLIIDNYDSFTYNLVQYFGELGVKLLVKRNDAISIAQIEKLKPQAIVISPGPCSPNEAGISLEVIEKLHPKFPILGVCLGHQAIGQVFGGKVVRAKNILHGKTSQIYHDKKNLFKDIPDPFIATRYHSLIVERQTFPDCLTITAWTEQNEIMGLRHKKYLVEGLQFHPESILTEVGQQLLQNFIKLVKQKK